MPDPEVDRKAACTAEVITASPVAPPAPEDLGETQAAAWADVWALPVCRYWAPSDMAALERLFRLRQLHDALLACVEADPLVAGSQGQMVLNPAARHARTVHAEVLALEDRFFLNPAHRLKGHISLAAAAEGAKRNPEAFTEEAPPRRADPRLARQLPPAS